MTFGAPPQAAPRFGVLVGNTLLGTVLAAAGVVTAYAAIATPLVSRLVPEAAPGGGHVAIGLGVWSLALLAAGALLVAGTSRLAGMVATVRAGDRGRGPAARALASAPGDTTVASQVRPGDGRTIPELVIGTFGVAVVHELPSSKLVRHGRAGWEARASDGWLPIEDPLDAAIRDADSVRYWLAAADLDFVVRVYAALVVRDRTIERSPTCAVISADQISVWIRSLPRQRTLTAGRLERLIAIARARQPRAG